MLYTITGPSGAGKTTLANALRASLKDLQPLESITTRPQRASDPPGEYRYVQDELFDKMVREEKFLWHVSVHRYRFGTTKTAVEQAISGGLFIAVLTIEAVEILHAYVAHRAKQSSVRSVYLDLTDEEELLRRLAGRKDTRDMQERIAECKDWGKKARAAAAPLRIIDARASREKILAETLTYFK